MTPPPRGGPHAEKGTSVPSVPSVREYPRSGVRGGVRKRSITEKSATSSLWGIISSSLYGISNGGGGGVFAAADSLSDDCGNIARVYTV